VHRQYRAKLRPFKVEEAPVGQVASYSTMNDYNISGLLINYLNFHIRGIGRRNLSRMIGPSAAHCQSLIGGGG
jgi:hypothetical protein